MAQERADDIRLAGAKLDHRQHVCAFFHSRDEEYRIMLPFIKEGVERGEKAFHIVDPTLQPDHRQRLEGIGIDTDELERGKQLEVRVWDQAYLRSDGGFDQNDMLSLIQEVLRNGRDEGFPMTRLVAHMEWALENRPGVNDVIEYESRLNTVLPHFHDTVICVYDLGKFSAGTVIDILRVHPMVLLGGTLQVNPFYIPPNEFLSDMHARRA